jgi:hypothetical protein
LTTSSKTGWRSGKLCHDLSDLDGETTQDKDKGKEKVGEKKDKEHVGEKHKAPQKDQPPHKRTNSCCCRLSLMPTLD